MDTGFWMAFTLGVVTVALTWLIVFRPYFAIVRRGRRVL